MSGIIAVEGWSAVGYLVVGEQIVAVDPGAPRLARAMVETVTDKLGRPASDLAWAVATHYHIDHIGGIPELMRLTGCRAAMPAGAYGHICRGEALVFPPLKRWLHMATAYRHTQNPMPRLIDYLTLPRLGLPLANRRATFPVDRWLDEGDELPGVPDWTVLATPGHTPDSICFWHKADGELLSGDTVLGSHIDGAKGNAYCWSRTRTLASLMRLEEMPVRRLFPGHGLSIDGDSILTGLSIRLDADLW